MQIIDYKYIKGTKRLDSQVVIPELDRYKSSVSQFIQLADLDITLDKPTAFIYVDGFSTSQSESGINTPKNKKYVPAIKSGSSYIAHEWIYTFGGKENLKYVNIVSSTCAAGIQAIQEAENLMMKGIKEVIIIGGERTTEDTVRLFRELRIPILCGDGFFYIRLGDGFSGTTIGDIRWRYTYHQNPFHFTSEDLRCLIPEYKIDHVKLHGTGTTSNDEAENELALLGNNIKYKDVIGHTQGVSSLLETCMVLDDDNIQGKILVTANSLGGFFGSFRLHKNI